MENVGQVEERDFFSSKGRGWRPASIPQMGRMGRKAGRILVVDDHRGVREATAVLLRDIGYEVSTAASADEALILFRKSPFGLVLTDLNMPGMDGWSLAEHIKKESSVPVVLITGSDRRTVNERFGKSSVDSVLFKPFRVEELLEVVIEAFPAIT
jgi:CheY-like chemotaxis protein